MPRPLFLSCALTALTLCTFGCTQRADAQIADTPITSERNYVTSGQTDQPFTVRVVGARRTVANILLIKLALTNKGTAPIQPHQDFAGDSNPTDENKISGLYAVDPNGRKKYAVLRDAKNQALCSTIQTPIQPGEQRMVFAQVAAPPSTTSTFDLYFPKANALVAIPMGLPQAGEPIVPGADVVEPAGLPTPASAVPLAPSTSITEGANNNGPTLYTNQTNPVLPNTPLKGVGTVQSANSTVPFTVDILSLTAAKGGGSLLKLAITNNSSGDLDAAEQFTSGLTDSGSSQKVSGVYLVDPVSKQRFEVVRQSQAGFETVTIYPKFSPGQRRVLEVQFPTIPDTVKSVYVYFPHATPIADVPVTR